MESKSEKISTKNIHFPLENFLRLKIFFVLSHLLIYIAKNKKQKIPLRQSQPPKHLNFFLFKVSTYTKIEAPFSIDSFASFSRNINYSPQSLSIYN
jgi:hypothetical protein